MEDTKVDDMYMENLEEWIFEEEKVVTYKFLSRSLKIHVNVAKQMLFNFVERNKVKHPDIGVVYLVSGLVPSNKDDDASDPYDQKVLCVKQEDLARTLKVFSSILSQHIYSVQQNNTTVSVSSLFCADQNKNSQDMSVAAIAQLNAIKHKNAVPREAVSLPPVIKKEIKTEPVVKKEPSKKTGGIQEAFNKATKKSSPEKSQPKQTKSAAGSSSSAGGSKGKGGGGIAGMFARQATSKPKPKSTEEKENIANQKIEADTSSGSKDSSPEKKEAVKTNPKSSGSKKAKTSGKKSVKADDGKKRKRIQVMSDSEEDEEEEEDKAESAAKVEEEEAPPVSKLIESDEEEEEIAATPVQETKVGRRRVKKLVDKTYMDDAGYGWAGHVTECD